MDPFIISNLPSTSFISDASQLSMVSSSGCLDPNLHHQDFVKFMQHVIALKVEILYMTWDPALERFNRRGGTGLVSKSGVNAGMAFSYKRFRPGVTYPRLSEQEFRKLQYSAMVNEMIVLACPGICRHSHIARLVGVCFEISPDASEVWPVLVLLTANGGDLPTMVSNNEIMREDILLRICGEISKGLHALHQNGVFHGDLNPRNILIVHNAQNGGMAVLLADFGFAKFGAADDLVKLPKTEPWEAVEWHPREFELKQVQKMDIYSVGLICLWLFFRKHSLVDLGLPSATVESAFLAIDADAVTRVQLKKAEGNFILDWSHQLVKNSDLGPEAKSRLKRVFNLTLDAHRSQRASSIDEVARILLDPSQLCEQDHMEPSIGLAMPAWHGTLDITQVISGLEVCDYRVHRFLVRALGEMANLDGCDCCRRNAAFQLALCHSVGFGVDLEDVRSTDWLSIAEKTPNDLAEAIESIKTFKPDHMYNPVDFPAKLGYHTDMGSQYEADGILAKAVRHYEGMVLKREQSLGPEHFSTVRLKTTLVGLMRRSEQFEKAMKMLAGITDRANLSLTDGVAINTLLARLWTDLGDIERAEPLMRYLLEWYAEGPEDNNPERLRIQEDLIELLLGRGGFDEALELSLKHVDECVKELGPDHEGTRGAYRRLAASYDAKGKLEDAIRANECIEDMVRRPSALRVSNRTVIHDTACLGVQYFRHGDERSSRRGYEKIMEITGQDGDLAAIAVNAVNATLIRLFRTTDNYEQVAEMLEALLTESTRVLGVDRKETITVMGNLARVYDAQSRLDDAVELERRVVGARRRVLGEAHPDTVVAMGNLRQTLLMQGEFTEAAEVIGQELASVEHIYGASSDKLVGAIETIAQTLESSGAPNFLSPASVDHGLKSALETARNGYLEKLSIVDGPIDSSMDIGV